VVLNVYKLIYLENTIEKKPKGLHQ